MANWRFWAPAQVIQFARPDARVRCMRAVVGTAWNVLLSSMDAKEQASLAAKEQETVRATHPAVRCRHLTREAGTAATVAVAGIPAL